MLKVINLEKLDEIFFFIISCGGLKVETVSFLYHGCSCFENVHVISPKILF